MYIIEKAKSIHKDFLAYVRRYLWPLPKFKREIVVMIDGKMSHGGLTDRFRNALSIYKYCKENDIPFRLYYVYPCDLRQILMPNEYDWTIEPKEISYSIYDTKELIVYVHPVDNVSVNEMLRINNNEHRTLLDGELHRNRRIQYHLYGNCCLAMGHYRQLWSELFRLTPYLENRINSIRKEWEYPYEAVTLRFQQLLGDFVEGDFEILSEDKRNLLISVCIHQIEDMYEKGYFKTKRLLVTSDSKTFIDYVKCLPYVYTIPGNMEHMDFTQSGNLEMNAKSFIDLILLSGAERLTLLQTGKMYCSGFPKFAAEIGGKEYNEIVF